MLVEYTGTPKVDDGEHFDVETFFSDVVDTGRDSDEPGGHLAPSMVSNTLIELV